MWVQHYLACDGVEIRGIRVHSRVNGNNDGIDIDCCQRVRISDCDIWSGDDAIVLKSTADRPCKDVVIANCVLSSLCNAIKLGTETNGGFENIAIANCSIYDTRLAGLTLQIVDGGTLDRVTVSNLAMVNVTAPLFLRLGDRGRPFQSGGARPAVGRMRNVTISNIEAVGAKRTGCAISGLAGHAIENVTLENVRLSFEGGGARQDAQRRIAENAQGYPEYNMFGVLPAYGLYCRHVKNLVVRNLHTAFERAEERPALACEDVEALEIDGARLAAGAVLAEQLALRAAVAPRPHLLIPVPLSAQRLAMRGFNPAHELAKGIGRRLDIPVRADACWRVRDTPPQTALPWRERRRNVKQAFVCTANLQGASVAVVDDVMTTGATVDALAQAILAAGARQVSAWVAARTLPGGYR